MEVALNFPTTCIQQAILDENGGRVSFCELNHVKPLLSQNSGYESLSVVGERRNVGFQVRSNRKV